MKVFLLGKRRHLRKFIFLSVERLVRRCDALNCLAICSCKGINQQVNTTWYRGQPLLEVVLLSEQVLEMPASGLGGEKINFHCFSHLIDCYVIYWPH